MKIQYMSIRLIVALVITTTFMWSCTDNTIATFTTPSTYKFTAPILEQKTYFVRDQNGYRIVTDTLEDFLVDNDILADSLNNRLDSLRLNKGILTISFKNSSQVDVTVGNLDKKSQKYIDTVRIETTYKLEANRVVIAGFEDIILELDNEFRELHQCYQAADRVFNKYQGDTLITARIRDYDFRSCQFSNSDSYINFMKNSKPEYKMDTLATYLVTVIYSNYK